jgi:glyoxylase-like metal-dependent hydrolase (beta-lactamase superfamily II)
VSGGRFGSPALAGFETRQRDRRDADVGRQILQGDAIEQPRPLGDGVGESLGRAQGEQRPLAFGEMAGGVGEQEIEAARPKRFGLRKQTDRLEGEDFHRSVFAGGGAVGSLHGSLKRADTGRDLAFGDEFPDPFAAFLRQVGEFHDSALVELEGAMPTGTAGSMLPDGHSEAIREIGWLVPDFATPEGHLKIGVHALLIQTPSMRMIVDTCIGNDKPRMALMFNMQQIGFLRDLKAAGWSRDSVDAVLCTHLHVDHVGWNTLLENGRWVPTFPRARYYMGRHELEHTLQEAAAGGIRSHGGAIVADSIRPILDAGLATIVEMDARLSPEVSLMPTPGHAPGHVSVVIESGGARAVITGDLMHHPCQMARPDWSSGFDDDQNASRAARHAFLARFADTPTLVIGTHFAGPTAGRIVRDGQSYRFLVWRIAKLGRLNGRSRDHLSSGAFLRSLRRAIPSGAADRGAAPCRRARA